MRSDEELKQDPLFMEAKRFVHWYRGDILKQMRQKIVNQKKEQQNGSG
ncbi:hypothetical protein LCGC14_1749590 [marine sediment metagenome]|uniref:Uncharacterized protein n=1 Tax=marine sediment metagenome TaxID=412755 RepID=A0A0F9H4C7_9ZZZZ